MEAGSLNVDVSNEDQPYAGGIPKSGEPLKVAVVKMNDKDVIRLERKRGSKYFRESGLARLQRILFKGKLAVDVDPIDTPSEFDACPEELYKIYDTILHNMDRENNLINQRIGWSLWLTGGFLSAQTFLLGSVLQAYSRDGIPALTSRLLFSGALALCASLSVLAIVFCYRTKLGVDAAQSQINYLKRRYYRLQKGGRLIFQEVLWLPRPFGNKQDHGSGNVVAEFFPFVMMVIWTCFALLEVSGALAIGFWHK